MKLKTYIEKQKESYRELAEKWDINYTSLFKYANGERTPRLKIALKIEKKTKGKVKVKDLLND